MLISAIPAETDEVASATVAEILASFSIEEIRQLVEEMEAKLQMSH